MSSRADTTGRLQRLGVDLVILGSAAIAAAVTASVTRNLNLSLAIAALFGGVAMLLIALDPVRVLLVLSVVRATLEGLQSHVLLRPFGVGLSPPDLLTIAILGGLVLWLLGQIRKGVPVWRAPTFWPAILLLTIATGSLLYSSAPPLGARDLVKFAAPYAAFLVIVTARPEPKVLRAFLGAIVASACVPILIGFWQLTQSIGHTDALHGGLRIESTFDHPNTYGFYLVAVTGAAWGLRWEVTGRRRLLVDMIGLAAFASTALTLSRNAWGAMAILVLVVGWRHRWVLAAAAACAVVVVAAVPRLLVRLTDFLHPVQGNNTGNSLLGRLALWNRDLGLWKTQPILGRGWGSTLASVNVAAHNDFLRALVEGGIVGFVAFVLLIFSLVRMGWRIGAARGDLPRAFLGLALGYTAVSVASNNLGKGAYQFYFWLIAGVAYVCWETMPDRSQKAPRSVSVTPETNRPTVAVT
jgi:putative inorganic carbon (HCO3(-)) transporter